MVSQTVSPKRATPPQKAHPRRGTDALRGWPALPTGLTALRRQPGQRSVLVGAMWATGQIQGFSVCESYKYVKRADPRCPLVTGDAPTWGMAWTHGDSSLGSSCDGRQWERGLWVQGKVRVVGAVRLPVTAARCVCVRGTAQVCPGAGSRACCRHPLADGLALRGFCFSQLSRLGLTILSAHCPAPWPPGSVCRTGGQCSACCFGGALKARCRGRLREAAVSGWAGQAGSGSSSPHHAGRRS